MENKKEKNVTPPEKKKKHEKKETSDERIIKLLEDNLKLNRKFLKVTKKNKTYIFWTKIYSLLKLVVFVLIIIFAFISVPTVFKELMDYNQRFVEDYQTFQNILRKLK